MKATEFARGICALALGSALAVCACARPAAAQDVFSEGFICHGIAGIHEGNIAAARRDALIDAQKKSVLEALGVQLSADDLAEYFLTLKNVFIDNPDIYLQRFKIVSEHSLVDHYAVTIRAFVQRDVLRNDLESMGIVGRARQTARVLFMIAERDLGHPEPAYWWASPGEPVFTRYRFQNRLRAFFAERGFTVIDPFEAAVSEAYETVSRNADPDPEAVSSFAARFNANVVVLGFSELNRVASRYLASLENIQCDVRVRVMDVRKKSQLVQAATHALGIHIDEASAAADAVDKAARRISEQIIDTIHTQMRSAREYTFKVTFGRPATEEEARSWLRAFQEAFPESSLIEAGSDPEGKLWTARIASPLQCAALVQKLYETGLEGYATDVVSVNNQVLELRVSGTAEHP